MELRDCEWIREESSSDLVFHCPQRSKAARISSDELRFSNESSNQRLAQHLKALYQTQLGCAECNELELV